MSRDLIRAHSLLGMLNQPGWRVVDEMAEQLVREAESEVIACEDESKVIALQRKAQAARQFWQGLKQRIHNNTQIENLTVSD